MEMKKEEYQKTIGDGKLPNLYFVFHYDQKFYRPDNTDMEVDELEPVNEKVAERDDNFLGYYPTFKEACKCIDDKSYLPHKIIEDRLTGVIYEGFFIVCPCCGKEEWEQRTDTGYTANRLKKLGIEFE